MTEIEVVGWLPIRIPCRIPDLPSPPDFMKCLEEFTNGLSSVLNTLYPAIVQAKIRITNPPKSISTDLRRLNSQYYDPQHHKFLQVKCVIAYDRSETTLPEDHDQDATLLGIAAWRGIWGRCLFV
jgi:hypothetical protein